MQINNMKKAATDQQQPFTQPTNHRIETMNDDQFVFIIAQRWPERNNYGITAHARRTTSHAEPSKVKKGINTRLQAETPANGSEGFKSAPV